MTGMHGKGGYYADTDGGHKSAEKCSCDGLYI
jgi:hypothetical protein